MKEQPGSASVVQGVTEDRFGIGYSGIGYRTSGVQVVALAEKESDPYSDGNYADVKSGKYPLDRFLYLYINKAPGKPLDPVVKEFCRLIFSKRAPGGRPEGRLPAAAGRHREAGAGHSSSSSARESKPMATANGVRQISIRERVLEAKARIGRVKAVDRLATAVIT